MKIRLMNGTKRRKRSRSRRSRKRELQTCMLPRRCSPESSTVLLLLILNKRLKRTQIPKVILNLLLNLKRQVLLVLDQVASIKFLQLQDQEIPDQCQNQKWVPHANLDQQQAFGLLEQGQEAQDPRQPLKLHNNNNLNNSSINQLSNNRLTKSELKLKQKPSSQFNKLSQPLQSCTNQYSQQKEVLEHLQEVPDPLLQWKLEDPLERRRKLVRRLLRTNQK